MEAFLGEAIQGVLQQKTEFPIELILGDDCSTDETLKIAHEYAAKYPDMIRVLAFKENLGIAGNTARTLEECHGKYVAICDSDDAWSDPLKLQKQVDFLEQNQDYGIVYTDVSYPESVRKHRRRFRPEQADSILYHSLPDDKMEFYYKTNDWAALAGDRQTGHISVKGIAVPFSVFHNEPERTDDPAKLGPALEEVLGRLWHALNEVR